MSKKLPLTILKFLSQWTSNPLNGFTIDFYKPQIITLIYFMFHTHPTPCFFRIWWCHRNLEKRVYDNLMPRESETFPRLMKNDETNTRTRRIHVAKEKWEEGFSSRFSFLLRQKGKLFSQQNTFSIIVILMVLFFNFICRGEFWKIFIWSNNFHPLFHLSKKPPWRV